MKKISYASIEITNKHKTKSNIKSLSKKVNNTKIQEQNKNSISNSFNNRSDPMFIEYM